MRIEFNMTPIKVAQFLKEHPVPQIADPDNKGKRINRFTDKKWITKYYMDRGRSECIQGRRKIEKENAAPEEDGFTEA